MSKAVKFFEVEEGSLESGNYHIVVRFNGREVDRFERPTMRATIDEFEEAGYKSTTTKIVEGRIR